MIKLTSISKEISDSTYKSKLLLLSWQFCKNVCDITPAKLPIFKTDLYSLIKKI